MATMRSTPESSLPDINPDVSHLSVALENSEEEMKGKGTGDGGVFGSSESGVNFRTMTWWHASVVFLKVIFATGVLTIPASFYALGVVPGLISLLIMQGVNAYSAVAMGKLSQLYPSCHTIADMAHVVGGPALREITGILFLFGYIISAATGIVGVTVGLNALSNHAICTNWFAVVTLVAVFIIAGIRKFENISWVAWAGFLSLFIGIMIVVVGVTTLDRPAAAPQTGDYELGFYAINHSGFTATTVALTNIFDSAAGTAAFLPVLSEMKSPRDYNKAVTLCMTVVTACYVSFAVVIYRYCGQWIATPALSSAGPLLKKVSYGIALPGLLASAGLWAHIGAKYLFVRILRNSEHLQKNSLVHWGCWIACVAGTTIASFLLALGVPIIEFIIALAGSLAFSPLALILPGIFWIYSHPGYMGDGFRRTSVCLFHGLLVCLGLFITVAGSYAVVQQIINAYTDGSIGAAFSCADNSNSS